MEKTAKHKILLSLIALLAAGTVWGQAKADFKEVNQYLEQIYKENQNFQSSRKRTFTPEILARKQIMESTHQTEIDSIFKLYGWLKPPLVSKKATQAYFLVIQQADIPYQQKYQNEVFKAAQERAIKASDYYLFTDRMRMLQNKYQIFGTQAKTDDAGNFYFIPIDTSLVSGRKIPVLPDGDYIYFSGPQFVTLFLHIYNEAMTEGIPQAQIYLDGEKIGETNDKGFFQKRLSRFTNSKEIKIRKNNKEKTIRITNSKNADWLDQNIILK